MVLCIPSLPCSPALPARRANTTPPIDPDPPTNQHKQGLSGKGAKGTMGHDKKGDKKKPTSRSARAGLQFPVGRIHRLLKVRVLLLRSLLCCLMRCLRVRSGARC